MVSARSTKSHEASRNTGFFCVVSCDFVDRASWLDSRISTPIENDPLPIFTTTAAPAKTLLEFLYLFPNKAGCERKKLAIANHFLLSFTAQHIAHELLYLRFKLRPGLAIEDPGFSLIKRPGPLPHRVHRHFDIRTAIFHR